jgi:hypothetical protein
MWLAPDKNIDLPKTVWLVPDKHLPLPKGIKTVKTGTGALGQEKTEKKSY